MTADDSEENLSMEDILSSIKNILEENGSAETAPAAPAPETPAAAPAPAAVEPQEAAVEEEVFNLSPSMMIDNPEQTQNTELPAPGTEPEISVDEAEVIAAPDSELNLPEIAAEPDTPLVEAEPEPLAAEAEKIIDVEPEPVVETAAPLNLDDVAADISSDPIYEPEEEIVSADASDIVDISGEDTPAIEDQFINQNIEQADSGVEDSLIDDETINEVISRAPLHDDDRDPTGNMTEIAAVEEAEKDDSPAVLKDDAVDVSADIINNFAKIFSEHKGTPQASAPAYDAPAADMPVGNGAATLEELLKSVIRDIIADEIKAQLRNSNLAVSDIALEEIKAQTNDWLNENLPAIVESVVQKEIERVMVKVGGN